MAEAQSNHLLVETPLLRVFDVTCRERRSGYGAVELNRVAQIALPRRGVFLLERRGQEVVVDPTVAVLLATDDEYRIGHPSDDGDGGIVLAMATDVLEEALGTVGGGTGRLSADDQFAVFVLTHTLRASGNDALETEDAVLLLAARLRPAFTRPEPCAIGPTQRRRIARAQTLLASAPAERWDLRTLARRVDCSPFHLARQFRAVTGETVSRYLLRLRLSLALERLAQGERDLTALALDAGFAHHSHLTARFGAVFGMTPAQARDALTKRSLAELRTIVAN
jgi:AraC-like DNA-binding protein